MMSKCIYYFTIETFGCSILCVNQTENSATTARKEVQLQSGTPCQTEEGRKGICLDNICAVSLQYFDNFFIVIINNFIIIIIIIIIYYYF